MRRVLAFLAAAAMVAGSLALRAARDDDAGRPTGARRDLRVVCTLSLAAACEAVGGTVEDAGTTADRLVADDPDVDVWIAPDPWPDLVEVRRQQEGRPRRLGAPRAVASTRLALVAWKDVLACGAEPSWKCVGDAVPKGIRPGHPDPTRDDIGLLVIGQAAVSFFGGRTELSSTTELEDPAFDEWFARLEGAVPEFPSNPLTRMLTQGRSLFDVVGTTEAAAEATLAGAAGRERVELLYPAPMARAVALVAPFGGVEIPESLRSDAAAALRAAGWSGDTGASGLPDAGFLAALVARWAQVVR